MFTQNEYLHRSLDVDSKSNTDNLQLENIDNGKFNKTEIDKHIPKKHNNLIKKVIVVSSRL